MKSFKLPLLLAGRLPWVPPRGAHHCQHLDSSPIFRSAEICLAIFLPSLGTGVPEKHKSISSPLFHKKKTFTLESHQVTNPYPIYMLNLVKELTHTHTHPHTHIRAHTKIQEEPNAAITSSDTICFMFHTHFPTWFREFSEYMCTESKHTAGACRSPWKRSM